MAKEPTVEAKWREGFASNTYLQRNRIARVMVGELLDLIALREAQWVWALLIISEGDTVLINRLMRKYIEIREGTVEMPKRYQPKSVFDL